MATDNGPPNSNTSHRNAHLLCGFREHGNPPPHSAAPQVAFPTEYSLTIARDVACTEDPVHIPQYHVLVASSSYTRAHLQDACGEMYSIARGIKVPYI